jgi:hypothetical protein
LQNIEDKHADQPAKNLRPYVASVELAWLKTAILKRKKMYVQQVLCNVTERIV